MLQHEDSYIFHYCLNTSVDLYLSNVFSKVIILAIQWGTIMEISVLP